MKKKQDEQILESIFKSREAQKNKKEIKKKIKKEIKNKQGVIFLSLVNKIKTDMEKIR